MLASAFTPEAVGEVRQRAVRLHAEKALVRLGRVEGSQLRHIGPQLQVTQSVHQLLPVGHQGASAVPPRAQASAAALPDRLQEPQNLLRVVVAPHQRHAGNAPLVTVGQGQEPFLRQHLADVALQRRAVAARASIGAAAEVHGQRHLVGELLEHDVVRSIFQHKPQQISQAGEVMPPPAGSSGVPPPADGRARSSTPVSGNR